MERATNFFYIYDIGELGLGEQATLLKLIEAIEEKRFLPMSGDHEVRSSSQPIAGTNRYLSAKVVAGRFREDLFARTNLWTCDCILRSEVMNLQQSFRTHFINRRGREGGLGGAGQGAARRSD